MSFQRFGSGPRPTKNELVVGVGSRAFVNWRPADGTAAEGVPMLDGSGARLANDLADGEEVEILSWLPRSRDGLSYQIRRLRDGGEWWIASTYLRRGNPAPAPATAAPDGNRSRA
jgi:hypothetical protein